MADENKSPQIENPAKITLEEVDGVIAVLTDTQMKLF